MGIPSEMRELLANSRSKSLIIASPVEDERALRTRQCTQGSKNYFLIFGFPLLLQVFVGSSGFFLEGVRAGSKAAAIACVASAVPTLIAARTIPWAKANLNYTGQALVISAASIAAYFITADKTILECARRNAHYKSSP